MPAIQTCPSRQALSDYALGRLGDDDSDSIFAHVRHCDPCLSVLDRLTEPSEPLFDGLKEAGAAADPFLQERQCRLAAAECASILSDASHKPPPDLGMLRDYRLIRELGRGGMGTVYEAIHVPLDRRVALKVLPPERMKNREAVSRFRREMRAIGKLDHPNIVRALDAGTADEMHFLVMEYIDGLDVATIAKGTDRVSVPDACEIARQAAHGLQYVHENGLVHRDIKPSNLMVSHQGQVRILDLGLALLSESLPEGGELTVEGQVMGTLDYMAPEQLGDAHEVDTRADIYSLGATLYRLLTGQVPYADARYNTPTKKLVAIATKSVEPIKESRKDAPQELVAVVDRMMAKNPEDRYATAIELVEAVKAFTSGSNLPRLISKARRCGAESGESDQTALRELQPERESVSRAGGSTFDEAKSALVETRPAPIPPPPQVPACRPELPIPRIVETTPVSVRRCVSRQRTSTIVVAIVSALILFVFASTIYYVQTDNGTLAIEVADESVELRLKRHGMLVYDTESNRKYTITAAGDRRVPSSRYAIRIDDDARLSVNTDEFTLTRGDRVVVRITRLAVPPVRPDLNLAPEEPKILDESKSASKVTLRLRNTLVGHQGWVGKFQFSKDGTTLVSPGADGTIRFWNVGDATSIKRVDAHAAGVNSIALSPDEQFLASASHDHTVKLWRLSDLRQAQGELLHTLEGHTGSVWGVAFSPDGKTLASASEDGTVILWDVAKGTWSDALQGHKAKVCWVAFSPSGETIVSSSADTTIKIWGAESATLKLEIPAHARQAGFFDISSQGRFLATASQDATIGLWDIADGTLRYRLTGHTQEVRDVAFSPDGATLASTSDDRTIRLWDTATGEQLLEHLDDNSAQGTLTLAFSPDGKMLATTNWEGAIELWDVHYAESIEPWIATVGHALQNAEIEALTARDTAEVSPSREWTPLFDGTALGGWETGREMFRVEDGAIVAGTLARDIPQKDFLCTLQEYGDFELKLAVKLVGQGASERANGGVQFRSRRDPSDGIVSGYQADVGTSSIDGRIVWGALWDESRRDRRLAEPDADVINSLVKPDDWNELRIRCEGPRIQIWLNGTQTVNYVELDNAIAQTGVIGLQIHSGPPAEVWYKDIQIRELH